MPPARSPVAEVLSKLSDLLAALGVRYYLFGAQAALLHGAARLTADIDITVDLGTQPTSILANALQAVGFELRVSFWRVLGSRNCFSNASSTESSRAFAFR